MASSSHFHSTTCSMVDDLPMRIGSRFLLNFDQGHLGDLLNPSQDLDIVFPLEALDEDSDLTLERRTITECETHDKEVELARVAAEEAAKAKLEQTALSVPETEHEVQSEANDTKNLALEPEELSDVHSMPPSAEPAVSTVGPVVSSGNLPSNIAYPTWLVSPDTASATLSSFTEFTFAPASGDDETTVSAAAHHIASIQTVPSLTQFSQIENAVCSNADTDAIVAATNISPSPSAPTDVLPNTTASTDVTYSLSNTAMSRSTMVTKSEASFGAGRVLPFVPVIPAAAHMPASFHTGVDGGILQPVRAHAMTKNMITGSRLETNNSPETNVSTSENYPALKTHALIRIEDFENDSDSPFDMVALKSLNDLQELSTVLGLPVGPHGQIINQPTTVSQHSIDQTSLGNAGGPPNNQLNSSQWTGHNFASRSEQASYLVATTTTSVKSSVSVVDPSIPSHLHNVRFHHYQHHHEQQNQFQLSPQRSDPVLPTIANSISAPMNHNSISSVSSAIHAQPPASTSSAQSLNSNSHLPSSWNHSGSNPFRPQPKSYLPPEWSDYLTASNMPEKSSAASLYTSSVSYSNHLPNGGANLVGSLAQKSGNVGLHGKHYGINGTVVGGSTGVPLSNGIHPSIIMSSGYKPSGLVNQYHHVHGTPNANSIGPGLGLTRHNSKSTPDLTALVSTDNSRFQSGGGPANSGAPTGNGDCSRYEKVLFNIPNNFSDAGIRNVGLSNGMSKYYRHEV